MNNEDIITILSDIRAGYNCFHSDEEPYYKALCEAIEVLKRSKQKGKWLKELVVLTSNPPQYRWHCSECGCVLFGFDNNILTDYCPSCGAVMEGEEYE